MAHPVYGGASRLNVQPLPYNDFDRQRDKLISQLARGYVTQHEFRAEMDGIDEAERRDEERRKADKRGR